MCVHSITCNIRRLLRNLLPSLNYIQRRCRHSKVHVARPLQINVHGGSTTGNVQRSKPTWLKRPVHNFILFKHSFRKRWLVGSLRNRATCRARLRSRTTASSGMPHIASSCTSYTHVYLATRGCRCSLGTRPTSR